MPESMRPEKLVNCISQKPAMKGISLSFGHRCIWVRSADQLLVLKVKGQDYRRQRLGKQCEYNIFVNI